MIVLRQRILPAKANQYDLINTPTILSGANLTWIDCVMFDKARVRSSSGLKLQPPQNSSWLCSLPHSLALSGKAYTIQIVLHSALEYRNDPLELENRNQANHISSPNIQRGQGYQQRLLLLRKEIFEISFRTFSKSLCIFCSFPQPIIIGGCALCVLGSLLLTNPSSFAFPNRPGQNRTSTLDSDSCC
jgi:hypothetical protein